MIHWWKWLPNWIDVVHRFFTKSNLVSWTLAALFSCSSSIRYFKLRFSIQTKRFFRLFSAKYFLRIDYSCFILGKMLNKFCDEEHPSKKTPKVKSSFFHGTFLVYSNTFFFFAMSSSESRRAVTFISVGPIGLINILRFVWVKQQTLYR